MKRWLRKKRNVRYAPKESTRYIHITDEELSHRGKVTQPVQKTSQSSPLPELYEKRVHCCGCAACYSLCPVSAITMEPDCEGFLYPVVDAALCITCYQCLTVCSFKSGQKNKGLFEMHLFSEVSQSE